MIDDSIPVQVYRITSTTVTVIGKTKSIKLVAFPNNFIKKTTLGIDFLATKPNAKSKDQHLFRIPEKPISKPKHIQSAENNDKNQPATLLDWILNPNNLKKPLYNIFADGTAEDDDLFAICAFMKRLPRPVSPIRRLEKLDNKLAVNTSLNKTGIVSVTVSTSTSKNNANWIWFTREWELEVFSNFSVS